MTRKHAATPTDDVADTDTDAAAEGEPAPAEGDPKPHPVGYVGVAPDPTPDEHYTVAGVIAGKPVPEHNR